MNIQRNSQKRNPFQLPIAGVIALACVIVFFAPPVIPGQRVARGEHWVGTWFAASTARVDDATAQAQPQTLNAGVVAQAVPPAVLAVARDQQLAVGGQSSLQFNNQTLRQVAHISVGGSRLRVVLSNTFGTVPLTIGAAQIALREKGATIVNESKRVLTFSGAAQTAMPAGAILVSDPVDLVVPDFADIVVDLYLPGNTAALKSPITIHPAQWQTNYVSPSGNFAGAITMPVLTTTAYYRTDGVPSATSFFLTRIEVMARQGVGAVVTIGDSITDGTHSTIDANNRWPDYLARRLAKAGVRMAVLNAGIGGNRILNDGVGPSALARFDRDVIAQTGVTDVIVFEGNNDIRRDPAPTAGDLIAGHKQMIERARTRGLRIFGATMTPFEGESLWTRAGEATRQAVNEWIRTSKAYDGVFDFDAAVRDPEHPTKLLGQYDPGDHIHLNAAGYEVMANTIDLTRFRVP